MSRLPLALLAALLVFPLAACDQEVPSIEQAASAVTSVLDNLDEDKVREIAKVAAAIEKDPSKAEALLKDHGLDRDKFEKTVKKIESDPNLKKLFSAAKEMAAKAQ